MCVFVQDVLNNLDSCDLDDDDLMLDADLPEDASLHSGVFVCVCVYVDVINSRKVKLCIPTNKNSDVGFDPTILFSNKCQIRQNYPC